jgi:uncharacterized protein YndB with AHSA1/START domain
MQTGIDLLLHRSLPASPEWIWELWTTPDGIGAWWAPDGFTTTVVGLDLRVGGALDYTMTATGPEQVSFMEQSGLPLTTRSHKEFTEVVPPSRLAYSSLIDFVPGVEPYHHRTVVTLERTESGTSVEMWLDPLHDHEWTERVVAGRVNELDNLHREVTANSREERLRV